MKLNRRQFLSSATASSISLATFPTNNQSQASETSDFFPKPQSISDVQKPLSRTYRAAAIGSTGNGNFGHGLDRMFINVPNVEFVAIADDDPTGLKKAGERNNVSRLYNDYREMLQKEDIDVVSVAMRHSIHHEKVVVDCANAGKHIFCEKPIAPDLVAADNMINACKKNNVKMTMAVQNRASQALHVVKNIMDSGQVGRLLTMRGRGKEDRRGGGEDLIVLGFHIMDLMRFFAGDPKWVFADILQDGRPMVKSDARHGREPNGLLAGTQIDAMYGFKNGVKGYFESHKDLNEPTERFNLELYFTDGMITLRSIKDVMILETPVFNPAVPHDWKPVTTTEWETIEDKIHWGNQLLLLDLLHAVEQDREPIASGCNGRWSLEMILGTYFSHFAKTLVELPLKERRHPLEI